MEYEIEFKITGKIDVENKNDLKQEVWNYISETFNKCIFVDDNGNTEDEYRFVTIKEHKSKKKVRLKET